MSEAPARTAAALVAYDGAAFQGWQRHPGKPTAQGALEGILGSALGREVRVDGAGRTDRGAHAVGQVASFALEEGEDPAELFAQVAGRGDGSLEVYDVVRAPDGFHARKDAVSKTYVYCLWRRELGEDEAPRDTWSVGGVRDLPGMQRALDSLVGAHDFAAFATPAKFERASTVRTVTRADLYEDGPAVVLTFEADAFLHKMVRNLVRAVVRVGEGKWSHRWIADALAAGDREASPGSAPASGLTLAHVGYPFPLFGAKVDDASGAEHDAEPRA